MMFPTSIFVVLLGFLGCTIHAQTECSRRKFDYDSIVCVCNSTYCDEIGQVAFPESGKFSIVTSSRDGLRFNIETLNVEKEPNQNATATVKINRNYTYQSMLGFGGGFTDAAGVNIINLSPGARENLLRAYYAPEGIEYSLGRVPMGGTDFSLRPYSYDEVEGDVALENFALAGEDKKYKIPLMLRAQQLSKKKLKLFGTPFSPPTWMKSNGKFNESGTLLKEYWAPYASYFTKFVNAYEAAGVPIWGLTPQDEPLSGFIEDANWPNCGWTAEDMRDFIKLNLGPTLEAEGMSRLKLMVHDISRDTISWYPLPILEDPETAKYIDGSAIHWYEDETTDPNVLDEIQGKFPDKWLLYTEACLGWNSKGNDSVNLGNWERAEQYIHSILESANHYSRGWNDWNLALDMTGGPNWAGKRADSPIIVNKEANEFYKQPMYYAIGHFSKFVQEDAVRIYSRTGNHEDESLETVAFLDTSGATVVVLHNRGEEAVDISLNDFSEDYLNFNMPPKSIQTVLYP